MIVKIKRNSIGKLEENVKEIAKNIEQNKKEMENVKEELREMEDTQHPFGRNLRKRIQRRGEKIIRENSPDPMKETGLYMPSLKGKPGAE